MPCDPISSEVFALTSPRPMLKISFSSGNSNVISLHIVNDLPFSNQSVVNYRNRIHLKSEVPQCVKSISISEKLTDNNHISKYSNMRRNPDNIHFLIHGQQLDQDVEDDSGFISGEPLNSQLLSCRQDHEILIANERELSACKFYYPNLDSVGAMRMLKNSSVGTFLIRDSSDARFLFSLSVKTQRGATSVRISYQEGWFSFDCDERIRTRMPQFHSVLGLIDHHVELSRQGINNSWRWEEKSGRKNMVVQICKPCRKSVPSLKHLSTIALNKSIEQFQFRFLQSPSEYEDVWKCIRDYPFKV